MAKGRKRWTVDESELAGLVTPAGMRSTRNLTRDDLDIVLQPIVDLGSGRIFAAEALARCRWDEFSSPATLFEHAAQEHAIPRLGRAIREVAIERAGRHRLFLNVHPDELSARWLVRPDDPINFHESELFLEITETAAFEYFDLVRGVLKEVCARTGARLVVDDLGAGHSNLKRVLDLEPAVVKLDRELIRDLDKNRRQRALVQGLVELCTDLGAKVVAEGVETAEELRACQDAGAQYAQGYFLARPGFPMPAVAWPP